ncbi:MAG: phosphohistidine phosphatase SixA [Candidatus Rokuibacteriota bacterium]
MEVYLARHGEAVAGGVDAARPLSARGREEIQRVGRLAARLGFRVGEIRHSGLLRARETAEILAAHLQPAGGVRETTGLRPDDDPWIAAAESEAPEGPLMLVGHLPHLGRLAAALVTGDPERAVVRFRTGTIATLTRAGGGWLVAAVTGPEQA